jgi:hypothetical protein
MSNEIIKFHMCVRAHLHVHVCDRWEKYGMQYKLLSFSN